MALRGCAFKGTGCRVAAVVGAWLIAIGGGSAVTFGGEAVRRAQPTEESWTATSSVSTPQDSTPKDEERIRLQLQIGAPQQQLAPRTRVAKAAAVTVSSRKQRTNPPADATPGESTDFLEALTAMSAAHTKTGRPASKSQAATTKTNDGQKSWAPRRAGDFDVSATTYPTTTGKLIDLSAPPRDFAAPDAHQLADNGSPSTRLALQPATQAPPQDESLLLPETDNGTNEERIPPVSAEGGTPVPPAPAGAGPAAKDTIAGAEKLGEEPVDNRLQFLRSEAVLLEPGQWQWDVGLVYAFQHDDLPIVTLDGLGNVVDVQEGQVRNRELFVPFAARYGLNNCTQLFLNAPVGWSNTELSVPGFDEFDNDGGIGDITFGATYLLSHNDCQDVMFTFAATAPTGGDPFDDDLVFPGASLGDGFWALSGELLCTHTYDPVVVFTTLGGRQYFERSHEGVDILPGAEWRWSMGIALAVSSKVTLSTRFAASFVEETEIDDRRIEGTIEEPMSIRFAATIAQCHRWFEPFVEFGTNADENVSVFGVIYTY